MTDIGYDYILQELREQIVEPPEDLNAEQLMYWMEGYTAALSNVRYKIDQIKRGQRE